MMIENNPYQLYYKLMLLYFFSIISISSNDKGIILQIFHIGSCLYLCSAAIGTNRKVVFVTKSILSPS